MAILSSHHSQSYSFFLQLILLLFRIYRIALRPFDESTFWYHVIRNSGHGATRRLLSLHCHFSSPSLARVHRSFSALALKGLIDTRVLMYLRPTRTLQ
jgi:hypothetical protein